MNALYLDPGLNGFGCAFFNTETKELIKAWYQTIEKRLGKAEETALAAHRACSLYSHFGNKVRVEIPRIYPAGKQKGDQNDLVQLAAMAGIFAGTVSAVWGAGCSIEFISPREWKGTLDADTMTSRIVSRINKPEEVEVLLRYCAKSLHHNIWDAVGIGLHDLGRLDARKVITR